MYIYICIYIYIYAYIETQREALLAEKMARKDDRDKKRADRLRQHLVRLASGWEPDLSESSPGSSVRYEPTAPVASLNRNGVMEKDWRKISHGVMARFKSQDKTVKVKAHRFPFQLPGSVSDFEFENIVKKQIEQAKTWCADLYNA